MTDKNLFHKTALDMSFLTRIISSARIILLPIEQKDSASILDFRMSHTSKHEKLGGENLLYYQSLLYYSIILNID